MNKEGYQSGVEEHSMVQFLKVADENSFVLESREIPYKNVEECREALRESYKDYIASIKQGMKDDFR